MDEFERRIIEFTILINELAENKVKETAKDIFDGVKEGTPVDTGRAKSSWILTAGDEIPSDVTEKVARPQHARLTGSQDSRYKEVEDRRERDADIELAKDELVYRVTNNVEYIEIINTKHNPGYIESVVEGAKNKVGL